MLFCNNLLSLGTGSGCSLALSTTLALALAGLEGRLLVACLQVTEKAAEDITDTTGTSGICALGIGSTLGLTASDSTASEAMRKMLEHVDYLISDGVLRTYPSRSWVIWSPPAA